MRGHAADGSRRDPPPPITPARHRRAERHALMRHAVRNGAAPSGWIAGGDGAGPPGHRRLSAADDRALVRDPEARPAEAGRARQTLFAVNVSLARLHLELAVLQRHIHLLIALRPLRPLRGVADEVVAVVR